MTLEEFNGKWADACIDNMSEAELRSFKNDCFSMYEKTGFRDVFNSPYDEQGEHNGMPFKVVRRAAETECDLEAMPLWLVEFSNGDTAYCYPEEICRVEDSGNADKADDCLKRQEKCCSMYLTVRVDVSYPGHMDDQTAFQTAYEHLDYKFKMLKSAAAQGIRVTDSVICDVNDED